MPDVQTESSNDQPLTPRQRLENIHPHIGPIILDEEALRDTTEAQRIAHQNALAHNAVQRGDNEFEAVSNADHAKPSKAIEKRTTARREQLNAQRAAMESAFELRQKTSPGSAANYLTEFFTSSAAWANYKRANTVAEVRPGETLRGAMDRNRTEKQIKLAEERAVLKAPQTEAEIRQHARAETERLAANLGPAASSLRGLDFHERLDRWFKRSLSLPKKGDGVDMVGFVFAIFGDEIAERLTARALANHREKDALSLAEREQRLKDIRAEIVRLEYQSEAIHRLARSQGENAGPRLTSNALAILDIEPA